MRTAEGVTPASRCLDPSPPHGSRDEVRSAVGLTLAILLTVVLVGWVHRRALVAFFSTDDLILLEQALGILPPPATAWRYLSRIPYFGLMLGLFGPYPPAFHLVSLLLHMVDVVLLAAVLRRAGLGRLVVLVTCGLFGCHPLIYSSLQSAVTVNDILALGCFLCGAWVLQTGRTIAVVLAMGLFLMGLFCKESILLLPLALPLLVAEPGAKRWAARRVLPIFVVAAAFGVAFFVLRSRNLALGGAAYAIGSGPGVLHNASTYLTWIFSVGRPFPDLAGTHEPSTWLAGAAVAIAGLGAAVLLPETRRSLAVAAIWFVAGGLPVLVLVRHTFAHYLYVPIIGVALAVATVLHAALLRIAGGFGDLLASRADASVLAGKAREPGRLATVAARATCCGLLALFAWQSDRTLQLRTEALVPGTSLPLDPIARRMMVAETAISSMVESWDSTTTCAAIYSPPGLGRLFGVRTGREYPRQTARPAYDLMAVSLDQGRAFRVFLPPLDHVRFVTGWTDSLLPCQLFLTADDGTLVSFGHGGHAPVARARSLIEAGRPQEALPISADLIAAHSDRPDYLRLRADVLEASGDTVAAREVARPLTVRSRSGTKLERTARTD